MTDPKPHEVPLNNTRIHYLQQGNGPMLLLIHGSLCDYRYWRWQTDALSRLASVVAPSLRGYWPAPLKQPDDHFGIEQHASDMLALMDALSPGRPVCVLGHSRGAQVATEMAIRAPERIKKLILADPGYRLSDEPESPPLHAMALQALRQGRLDEALSGFVNAVNGQDIWRHMVGWFKTMVQDNAYTLLSQERQINLAVDTARLMTLSCPVLLISGSNSPDRYTSRAERLEHLLPQAQRVTIPLASHGMNLANPKAFNQAVQAFMGQP
jgi:pimeloyl-ACP methyl ester carboxylesterase